MRRREIIAEHFAGFAAEWESLDEVRQFVRGALSEGAVDTRTEAALLLAVEEAVGNVVRHGYLFAGGRFQLRVRRSKRAATLILTDNGRPFPPDWESPAAVATLAETGRRGGLGLRLLRRLCDTVEYRRIGEQNVLTLTKYLRPSAMPRIGRSAGASQRRAVWIGGCSAVVLAVLLAFAFYRRADNQVEASFSAGWWEFGRAAAAAASQHLINNRSDAEFDQLAVGLAANQPDIGDLVIVDQNNRLRADARHPERVHAPYAPPTGVPPADSGEWSATVAGKAIVHFTQPLRVGDYLVGRMVWTVRGATLAEARSRARVRVIVGAVLALLAGGIIVGVVLVGITRPLRRLREILHRASSQGVPSASETPPELADVLATVSDMTEAAARSERQTARRDWAQREMEQAEQLQQALLPTRLPDIPGYEASAAYRMAGHVGGDYYDVFPLPDHRGQWIVIIADVAGKGFPAALMMTAVRTAVRLLAPVHRTPAAILAALDEYLNRNHAGGPFVTAICGLLDSDNHTFALASAGHTPALACRADTGAVMRINPKGRPVGIGLTEGTAPASPAVATLPIAPGDLILLYTDGASEARSSDGGAYGIAGLEGALATSRGQSARAVIDTVLRDLGEFTQDAPAQDDVTLLLLRRAACPEVSSPVPDDSPMRSPNEEPAGDGRVQDPSVVTTVQE